MRNRSTIAIWGIRVVTLAVALAATSLVPLAPQPALAAKHQKASGACAQSGNRCISDCDALDWCTMYTCINGQSTPVPLWRCYEPSGLCLAPHC